MKTGIAVDGLKVAKARAALPHVDGREVSQVRFAEMLGVHAVTMNRIESGKARVSLELLERIAAATGKPRDSFRADAPDIETDLRAALVAALARVGEELADLVESVVGPERVA